MDSIRGPFGERFTGLAGGSRKKTMSKLELAEGRLLSEEIEPHLVRLTIRDPQRRNALDLELARAFYDELGRLSETDVRALIVTGTEKAFCSGFNIGKLTQRTAPPAGAPDEPANLVFSLLDRVEGFPVPTIAMLNGHTFGWGGELAVTCDFRIAGPEGKFGMPPAKLGLCYHHTGLQKFLELVGPAIAKEMFFTGEPFDMEEAARVGLVTHLVATGELESKTVELARRIIQGAPLSVKGMKRSFYLLQRARPLPAEALSELQQLVTRCFMSQDFFEGQAAFLQKRQPNFKGK